MTNRSMLLVLVVALANVPLMAQVKGPPAEGVPRDERAALSLNGHTAWVSCVVFSSDGKHLASGGDDGVIKIWDAVSGKVVLTIRADSAVTCIAYDRTGKRLASGGWDRVVRVWDADSGQEVRALTGHRESITCVAFSPDGKRLASGSGDDTLKVWDAASGKEVFTVELDDDYDITCLAFSPDGKHIATGDGEKRLTIWDASDGTEVRTAEGHAAALSCLAYSPDGKRLVSGSHDRALKVWDAVSGQELLSLDGHGESVTSVIFSPDGKQIASGSEDGSVKVWDAASGKESYSLRDHPDKVTSVAFSPDGRRLASASKGTVKVWPHRPAEGTAPPFTESVQPFLVKHCLSCHGATKQTFGIRFDRIGEYRSEDNPLWTRVHGALTSRSMPPEGRNQPDEGERKRVLTWIENAQRSAPTANWRRLNRRELSAALQDLTGLSVDYAHALPADAKLGGFDTGADTLQDSADSVEELMKVTRRAVDALRFRGRAPGTVFAADLGAVKDPRQAFDTWKNRGATVKTRGFALPGKGLLLEPRWVGERDEHSITLPAPKDNRGVLRLKLSVSALKPVEGLPHPHLWVRIGGTDIAFAEISASPEKPQELVYEVQLDDLAIDARGVKVSLSNKIEVPYSVAGYENEEVNKKGEDIPGGTGWFRPAFDHKLPPQKQPAPSIVLQQIEIEVGYVAAWPPAFWKLDLEPVRDDEPSAKRLLGVWIDRAWRRPVSPEEQEKYLGLYRKLRGQQLSFDDALRATFQAVLLSGGFRYLPAARESHHAVASRLSFMLWGTPPDAELRARAAEGKLRDPTVLDTQVDRLLSDPRSDGFIRPFVVQWLEMDQPITIAASSLKKQDFRFARYLKASMREETVAYLARLFRDNRPAKELITSNWTMMNDSLAIHYDYKGIEGGHLRPVTLRPDDRRGGGVLGHAGIQSMLCWMGGNWVIYRGAWVMRHILDDPPPPPPLEVPELNPSDGKNRGKSFKELLKQHQESSNCAVCHRKIDPIGFAFQNFDISGRWRDREYESYHMADLDGRIEWRGVGKERAVDSAGILPRGERFTTFADCKQLIVKNYQADMVRGLLKNLIIYATGRLPDVHDMAEARRALKEHEARGYPLRDLLKALVRSNVFLER